MGTARAQPPQQGRATGAIEVDEEEPLGFRHVRTSGQDGLGSLRGPEFTPPEFTLVTLVTRRGIGNGAAKFGDDLGVASTDQDAIDVAARLLAQARAEAEAIRREALVTAEGIRQIAVEDARSLDLTGSAALTSDPVPRDLLARLEKMERKVKRHGRKVKRQGRQIERLENVLLGLAPGLTRRKK